MNQSGDKFLDSENLQASEEATILLAFYSRGILREIRLVRHYDVNSKNIGHEDATG